MTTDKSLDALKGQKATMLIQNSAGATVARHIRIHEKTNAVQNKFTGENEYICLYYAIKGKRKVEGFKISAKETKLILAPGWQHLEGMEESARVKGQFSYDSWTCFGDHDWDSAAAQIKNSCYRHG